MTTFAVQYLGTRPKEATPAAVRQRLREAFERLPISMVLLDWELPPALEEAVAEETSLHHAKLYRWQTWLTGDSQTDLPAEWAVVGLNGKPISGYANEVDFTFICPNRNGVQEFLSERMETIAARGMFQGIFLDRIRFPSPAVNPEANLGCFCPHCHRLAAERGFNLEAARLNILTSLKDKEGAAALCRSLLGKQTEGGTRREEGLGGQAEACTPLEMMLDFREESISRAVGMARRQAASLGLEVGLDCFSPALARMVGQDLKSLGELSDWVKIMTYPRVFGPAGISFELLDLVDWLISKGIDEQAALRLLQTSSGLSLPPTRADLRRNGLDSGSIAEEIRKGRDQDQQTLLAGIALVDLKGIHESTPEQIQSDLLASRGADGLVLSWDLWRIPLQTLDMIRSQWET